MKRLIDIDRTTHSQEPGGVGYTLCGLALEGENGDTPMKETFGGIDCEQCIEIINFCKRIKNSEIKLHRLKLKLKD